MDRVCVTSAKAGVASSARPAAPRSNRLGRKALEQPFLGCFLQFLEAADRAAVDHDLGKRHVTGELDQLPAADRILGEVDLDELELVPDQEILRADAPRAGVGRVDRDAGLSVALRIHPAGSSESRHGGGSSVAGAFKTEGNSLRPLFL